MGQALSCVLIQDGKSLAGPEQGRNIARLVCLRVTLTLGADGLRIPKGPVQKQKGTAVIQVGNDLFGTE